MEQYILAGGGMKAQEIILNTTANSSAKIAYIFDNYIKGDSVFGIPIIRLPLLKEIYHDYTVVVTPENREAAFELCLMLRDNEIPFILYHDVDYYLEGEIVHIYSEDDSIRYKWINTGVRNEVDRKIYIYVLTMWKAMFDRFSTIFQRKNIDFYIFAGDLPEDAHKNAVFLQRSTIFCFCTVFPLADVVIPVPSYRSFVGLKEYPFVETIDACEKVAKEPHKYKQAFWQGSFETAPRGYRKLLDRLYVKNKELLEIRRFGFWNEKNMWDSAYKSMLEYAEYKYLIDIGGASYADRTMIYLQLGRPILYVDRIYKEWFTDKMEPMKHYIPVKADLSDLIDQIRFMEENPELYKTIVQNMGDFSKKYFTAENILNELKDAVLHYGIVED